MSNHPPRLNQYLLHVCIGEGNFAKVFKAIYKKEQSICAIKVINEDKIKTQPKVLELLHSEIKVLQSIDNKNVIKLSEWFNENKYYYLVMEFCNGGDLEKYIKSKPNKIISEAEAIGFFKQLLNGFKALHEIKAMHRDFKLANVLMHEGVLKIADLGFSKQADLAKTALGTGLYMAPEIMKYQQYDNKVDIWSLGICLYEMLYGEPPFYAKTELQLLKVVEQNIINFNLKGISVSPMLQELIRKMLIVDPKKRISWMEIYNHPILNDEPPKPAGNLLQSVYGAMKSTDLDKQYQNILFQKNKNFYADNKNNKYDNEDTEKMIQQIAQKKYADPVENKKDSDEEKDQKLNKKGMQPKKNEDLWEKIDYPNLVQKNVPNYPQMKNDYNLPPASINPFNNNNQAILEKKPVQPQPQTLQKGYWESQEKYIPPPLPQRNQEQYYNYNEPILRRDEPSPRNMYQPSPKNFYGKDPSPSAKNVNIMELDDNKLLEMVNKKKDAFQLYENKYLHYRNIISHHAKVLGDGFNLNCDNDSIYMYFVLAKMIKKLSTDFLHSLEKKENFLNLPEFFKDFAYSEKYKQMIGVFIEEKAVYDDYFCSLLEDIKAYKSSSNPMNETLKGELNNKIGNNLESLFKEVMLDFLFRGMNIVESFKKDGKKDNAKRYVIHLINIFDCLNFRGEFPFEEEGFSFEKYDEKLTKMNLKNLEEKANEKFDSLLNSS